MGILNLTSDSFYDGGKNNRLDRALIHSEKMINQGALFIDVGAASSKPGSKLILPDDEKKMLLPILEKVMQKFPEVFFSIDTYNSSVAKCCLEMGAHIINDISAGRIDSHMHQTVAQFDAPFIMMHMQGLPETMQKKTNYKHLISDVLTFFSLQIEKATAFGIHDIIIDPGFGFGKNIQQNYALLQYFNHFLSLDLPLMMGISRKSMIYKVLKTQPEEALNGTTALHAWGLEQGAQILRVHDVKEAKECIDLWLALHSFS
ncbi:MAG: dihydropteroate synthase [Flavobacteriaceae bacterium]